MDSSVGVCGTLNDGGTGAVELDLLFLVLSVIFYHFKAGDESELFSR